ncbi:hypothetical protein AJ88_38285 [Mesorhizobium amorphae CCBAU 01583]|nr:hypothetical protein AJ88_38285 [Mesorhizobium amorphae CCBAU 01583]
MAAAIVGGAGIAPESWPDEDFDSIWVLQNDGADVWSFAHQSQALLEVMGDRSHTDGVKRRDRYSPDVVKWRLAACLMAEISSPPPNAIL